jgi:Magnesium chelatase, subunit ChlI
MLARRLTTILPAITLAVAMEITRVHRVAGLTGARTVLVTSRPCRASLQTISAVGLIGGGPVPMLREVSRAHHGVRFLDESPECRRHVLEAWRQPLEESVTYLQCRGRLACQCFDHVCGLWCGHQFAEPRARGVAGLSGFARVRRASANPQILPSNSSVFEAPAYSCSPYSRLNSASISLGQKTQPHYFPRGYSRSKLCSSP